MFVFHLWDFYGTFMGNHGMLSNKVTGFPWGKYGDLTSAVKTWGQELEVELGNTFWDFGEQFTTIIWLVVWNMFVFIYWDILGISSSQLTNSYFSEG